ncbi:DUF222 domain-containing protein [Microbacterium saccharophilum]|uniref:DUF222 domain-containing protein n=1 Tax=Microbacterium saccharophilum TaxID=1213358 RepID=A0A5C8I8J5_9MICO|nr:HNH endonuclease signature motif containing protein [Microbacterium saccharophilum]TXK14213.1 DUF222 domain-containing protein [Microbacterium saccharophilum]GEP46774.1 hypothetical protein MSA03_02820 [Microbacterium saccharophilum]
MKFSSTDVDPQGDLWSDPAFVDEYLAALCDEADGRFAGQARVLGEPDDGVFDEVCDSPAEGSALALLEDAAMRARALSAAQDQAIAAILDDAAADPGPWVGPDPTLDPAFKLPPHDTVHAFRARRREFAVRAAVADIAVRLRLSELGVRGRGHRASVLQERCPQLWSLCVAGTVSEQNMAAAAVLADTLPPDAPETWAAFDSTASPAAVSLAPGRFRMRARTIRERVHPESLEERHARAREDRDVRLTPLLDGMSQLTALVPADKGEHLLHTLDTAAAHLAGVDGETRTLAQLRADVLCDLTSPDAPAGPGKPAVSVTVPVLTLLGASDEPATLDGYGPIDLDTARRLAGEATSWTRILTHPIDGTVLDLDRTTYRVPVALRRWLGVRDPVCIFPGCGRPSADCDIDHRQAWAHGGRTAADNTAPLCRSHHRVKHETLWRCEEESGDLVWVSPSGLRAGVDPPPF